jgi:hypothetical protein
VATPPMLYSASWCARLLARISHELSPTATAPLAQLRQRPAAIGRGSPGRAAPRVPVVVPPHRVRALRQGADDLRDAHAPGFGDMLIRDIIDRMRHDGCGGRAGRAELLTGIDGSSRPVRKIVLPLPRRPNPVRRAQLLALIMKSVFRLAARRTICPRGLPAGIRAGK